jgi:hypothetical protein
MGRKVLPILCVDVSGAERALGFSVKAPSEHGTWLHGYPGAASPNCDTLGNRASAGFR